MKRYRLSLSVCSEPPLSPRWSAGKLGCRDRKRQRNVALISQALVNFGRSKAGEIGGDQV